MNDVVLKVDNLCVELMQDDTPQKLLTNLSFELLETKTLALVGGSGAGKSITALALMGLLPSTVVQTSGEVLLRGQRMSDLGGEQIRKLRNTQMAMIMQNPMSAFDAVFTIRSHFIDTLKAHLPHANKREMEHRACHALGEVGFSHPAHILNLYPFQMSGGMLQRVMIALALIHRPQLLIADEATTDLDVVTQASIIELIQQKTKEQGMSVLLITHDLSIAAHMADDIVIMNHGQMVESNTTQQIFSSPQQPFTKQLIDAHLSLYQGGFSAVWNDGLFSSQGVCV